MGMGTGQTGYTSTRGDIEITGAAVRSYGKLMVATGGRVAAHAIADGGMICEDRTRFARPVMWRILPDGIVLLVLNFSTWYASIGTTANWAPKLTRLDGLAVTLGTLTTAGAPGITPHSELARGLVTTQLVVDILAAIVLFGLFVGRLARERGAGGLAPQPAGRSQE